MSQQINAMMRSPYALMEFQQTGKLPRLKESPSTPLRELISHISPRMRSQFQGVKLHPSLGFNSNAQFNNLSQLYTWLGNNKKLAGNQTMPYMSCSIKSFNKKLTVTDLIQHCAMHPSEELILKHIRPSVR